MVPATGLRLSRCSGHRDGLRCPHCSFLSNCGHPTNLSYRFRCLFVFLMFPSTKYWNSYLKSFLGSLSLLGRWFLMFSSTEYRNSDLEPTLRSVSFLCCPCSLSFLGWRFVTFPPINCWFYLHLFSGSLRFLGGWFVMFSPTEYWNSYLEFPFRSVGFLCRYFFSAVLIADHETLYRPRRFWLASYFRERCRFYRYKMI